MDGSSDDSSRGLNSSAVSGRNTRLVRARSIRSSGDNTSQGSGSVQGRKVRNRIVLARTSHLKTKIGGSESVDPLFRAIECNDVSLRQWLDNPERAVDALECLHIFAQIVEIVYLAHTQGIVLHNVRPSCFIMSSYNRVSFIESASCSDSGSDSFEDGSNNQTAEFKSSSSPSPPDPCHGRSHVVNAANASCLVSETSRLQSSSVCATRTSETGHNGQLEENKPPFPMKQILLMETTWYTSPEEVAGGPASRASDIYRLGILLFELFCSFSSAEEKATTMSSLRHRVLPPQLLLRWPKEASFCLWLLHPDPSSRPEMGELMQSEFLNEPRNKLEERDAAIELKEKIEEQELLLEFLLLIQQRKQEAADNLHETVSYLSSDLEEVMELQKSIRRKGSLGLERARDSACGPTSTNNNDDGDSGSLGSRKRFRDDGDSGSSGSRKRFRQELLTQAREEYVEHPDKDKQAEPPAENQSSILFKSSRLINNFRKLEIAYFLTRRRTFKPSRISVSRQCHPISSDGRGSMAVTERSSVSNASSRERYDEDGKSGWVHSFLEGLCKYLSFSKLKVKADLKQGDLLNASNLVCSLGFDRDGEFFATAGVNKKIKVFEYNSILDEERDIHYPVVEMASRSKLSSICWNGYIKSQIASSNFEGVVQVWDVARSQIFMEMKEHEKRIWSVDFSLADPTMLASGSDDGSVKLWNINQGASVGTIKTKANVCCVQFPSDSGRSLAFGSADHRIYYYDLRNAKMPLCTLTGHNKTVSYVKFIDSMTLVSASTDNSLKLWDLSMCTARVLDSPLISFTGHMNVKNFVGLSVSDGYIATGSETNEVFVYHKAFPMPALSYKFSSTDPLSGDEVDDPAQFISSVCWRGQSSTLLAANSLGNIKILEMV